MQTSAVTNKPGSPINSMHAMKIVYRCVIHVMWLRRWGRRASAITNHQASSISFMLLLYCTVITSVTVKENSVYSDLCLSLGPHRDNYAFVIVFGHLS